MRQPDISDMPVAQIMQTWPHTVPVFLKKQLFCVGCPISGFHTVTDAAREHGAKVDELETAIMATIMDSEKA